MSKGGGVMQPGFQGTLKSGKPKIRKKEKRGKGQETENWWNVPKKDG